jgi:lipopolysaccharide export LptBFGC system permease protein LptF
LEYTTFQYCAAGVRVQEVQELGRFEIFLLSFSNFASSPTALIIPHFTFTHSRFEEGRIIFRGVSCLLTWVVFVFRVAHGHLWKKDGLRPFIGILTMHMVIYWLC